ncbi:hypothetical protein L873DRAFT_1795565 [Choiromyces venosus 120613-1]|uniref:Uncharacterized protein n=1 Tax=Choiromyces venosus 120613-1 TaxID=1336337 RepID=A0A3N4IZT8_9PEZI|nr:hypothetical protein L873DRAFT_1795565 [Choiromyces venosus 120613-1]
MSDPNPHHRPTPTSKPPVNPYNPPQTIITTTPTQGITLTTITKTLNYYPRIYEVFKVDDTFLGTGQEKGKYQAEYLSRCNTRDALEVERREFERMGGQTSEVLRVWTPSSGGSAVAGDVVLRESSLGGWEFVGSR